MKRVESNYSRWQDSTDVDDKVTTWLAHQFDTKAGNIRDLLYTQNATVYLLIWPIMEQVVFQGFMQGRSIVPIAEKMGSHFDEMDADDKAQYFHDRYQNEYKYKHLTGSMKYEPMEAVLAKDYTQLNGTEKMILMMTTVFRYRNNIFHGMKAIVAWNEYSKEIAYCTEFMMAVVDIYRKYYSEELPKSIDHRPIL